MTNKETIQIIIDVLDRVESSWESSYRQDRLPIIAKQLLNKLESLGYVQKTEDQSLPSMTLTHNSPKTLLINKRNKICSRLVGLKSRRS